MYVFVNDFWLSKDDCPSIISYLLDVFIHRRITSFNFGYYLSVFQNEYYSYIAMAITLFLLIL